ncbi:unnamed protein product [Larinioides sclopetarius]|uniref:Uncharacterized protein n=1 Tax=Larinioides sclopetarius TaxID=280406 RepID=A0AAV1ZJA6_9ARAC
MNVKRYYFPTFIEDDTRGILAVQAKEILQQNDNIVKIFEVNNNFLYGHSPRRVLFLMKQNNKSIFSSSPSNEIAPKDEKTDKGLSTPVTRNPQTSNIPRRHLPLDDTEKKVCHSATLDPSTPLRRHTVIVSSKDNTIQNPTIDEIVTSDEQASCAIASTSSSEASKQEFPRFAEIVKMTANLTMAEKELGSPGKVVGSMNTCRQESSRSAEISMMSTSFITGGKELESPEKVVDYTNLGNKESPLSAEITKITSSLTVDVKESGNLIQDYKIAGSSATNKEFLNPEEDGAKSYNPGLIYKDSITHAEEMESISELTIIGSETHSPVRRSKTSSISAFDFHEFASLAEKVRNADSSPEEIESCLQGDKVNVSPNEASKGIASAERKMKTFSPKKENNMLFRSIPRVMQYAGKEIYIEVPCNLEDNASPTTSRSLSEDYRSDLKKVKIKSPVVSESKPETSPKTIEWCLSPSDRSIGSVSTTDSPSSDEDSFAGKYSSDIPSIKATATGEKSSKYESSFADIETGPLSLNYTMRKFNALLSIRDQVVKKMFCATLSFQNSIQFLSTYLHNVANIVLEIGVTDKRYLTKQLKDSINDARSLALKLEKKLKIWKTDQDLDVTTWHKCFQQIQRLKTQYEPLLTSEGQPAIAFEVVQVYEFEMKSIWKIMDDMIMMGDTRRALFSHIAHDVEKLMKVFVKCLILVGILHPRIPMTQPMI